MDFFLRLKKDEGFFTRGGGTGSDPVWWRIERRSQNSAVSPLYRFLWLLQFEDLSRACRMTVILVTTSTGIVEVQDSFKSRDVAAPRGERFEAALSFLRRRHLFDGDSFKLPSYLLFGGGEGGVIGEGEGKEERYNQHVLPRP